MALVIRKRVSLDFLGDEYKDAYLVFQAIPVSKLVEIQAKMPTDTADSAQSIPIMLDVLKEFFLDGEFPDKDGNLGNVEKDDLDNLNSEAAIQCFQGLSGVNPKAEGDSKISSTPSDQTEQPAPNPP